MAHSSTLTLQRSCERSSMSDWRFDIGQRVEVDVCGDIRFGRVLKRGVPPFANIPTYTVHVIYRDKHAFPELYEENIQAYSPAHPQLALAADYQPGEQVFVHGPRSKGLGQIVERASGMWRVVGDYFLVEMDALVSRRCGNSKCNCAGTGPDLFDAEDIERTVTGRITRAIRPSEPDVAGWASRSSARSSRKGRSRDNP